MRIIIRLLVGLALVCTILLVALYLRSPIEPVVWQPSPNPGLTGPFEKNTLLATSRLVSMQGGDGPEDITRGPDGLFYTGLSDGRIVRVDPQSGALSDFANTGGRPLGMQFDAQGQLLVADSKKGLLSVSTEGIVTVLTNTANGKPMLFVDDLDIADDGTIWFSDASQRFGYEGVMFDLIEAQATGRLLSYSPASGETKVHLEDLAFANGVALGPNDEWVLINDTGRSRIMRLWLQGERAGESEVFIDGLPAMPDNLSFNGRDRIWVALVSLRSAELEALADKILLRKLITGLPSAALMPKDQYAFVLGLDLNGEVVTNLQGSGERFYAITSVNEFDGNLYLGSLLAPDIAIYPLK
ncbi:MAG: sugar lactone lactonase YvrE [Zhongshania sp.]|jgi:sugar lactone lactonase YvrE